MEHLHFTTNQTAAAYVAHRLDPQMQEAFEMHMMECGECLREVESWRAIKATLRKYSGTPQQESAAVGARSLPEPRLPVTHAPSPPLAQLSTPRRRWAVAAALAAAVTIGAAGGWSVRSVQGNALDSDSAAFYALPSLARGPTDCVAVALESATRLVVLRVPGAAPDQRLVAIDSEGHDLAADGYRVRSQADGSWLVRLRATVVREQGIRFEARSADGTAEPRGCVQSTPR